MPAPARSLSRKSQGITSLVVAIVALTILLPIGLLAFEIARVNLAQKQLRAATDSAALAAASILANSSGTDTEVLTAAKSMALEFFKRNQVTGVELAHTTLSTTTNTDSPVKGHATLDVTLDKAKNRIRVMAAFGSQPAFADFLSLGTVPIRSHSLAGYTGLEGDIVMVVDISDSMLNATKSVIGKRTYDATTNKVSYKVVRASKAPAHIGRLGSKSAMPNPLTVNLDTPLLSSVKDSTPELKLAALMEAKRGNLESQEIFESSKTNTGPLNGVITPQSGYKAEFQEVALRSSEPLASEKVAISEFVNELQGSDNAHLGLVTFGKRNSEGADAMDSYSTYAGHIYPHINLSKTDHNKDKVVSAIYPSLTFYGTDTKGGMVEAINMLTGPQHRDDVAQTIILLTDGCPTTGSPKPSAKLAGEKGIRLFAIGFFQTANANAKGKKPLQAMVAACGNGSKMYLAPDLPTLRDVLKQISHGTLALINDN